MKIGANYKNHKECEFIVWSPLKEEINLEIITPEKNILPMKKDELGYWKINLEGIKPGTLYWYQLEENKSRPDPASYYQPLGVHKYSCVVDHSSFKWQDSEWKGIPLEDYLIYELHVGTFTPESTFQAIIPRLEELIELGINAIEIMPVAQFPGDRNWGYDGVYPFAVQSSYGGCDGLKQLVNACHQKGMAVILDVVYNHLGPEGNYTQEFAPYFTHKYQTPWGSAINYDDAYSYGVRNYFIENVLYWLREYHIDALRLDAVHAIYDFGAKHILLEMAEKVEEFSKQQGRDFYLIAESDLNDVRIIQPKEIGGYNIHAQWSDDFHHCLHTILTKEKQGYYEDFGQCDQLTKVFNEGFAYSWNYSPHRKRNHGNYAGDLSPKQFVVCSQNHDQVGNRMLGERLTSLVSFEALKLAAATVLLSPYIPMLFMGEEYGEESPFLYFIDHGDTNLIEAVRQGRKEEFKAFHQAGEPPDAASIEALKESTLKWELRQEGKHKVLLDLYRELIQLRKQHPALKNNHRQNSKTINQPENKIVIIERWDEQQKLIAILNFEEKEIKYQFNHQGNWQKILDSSQEKWLGKGTELPEKLTEKSELKLKSESFVLYQKIV